MLMCSRLGRSSEEKAAQEARLEDLMRLIERAKIELETGKRPPPDLSPRG
jgi:hypothetical protein